MDINRLLGVLVADPVNLSRKGKGLAVVACFAAIWGVAWLASAFHFQAEAPLLIASMGASAVILFIIPNSPLAQPWPLLGGHTVSAAVGVACAQLLPDMVVASACAAGGSVLLMLLLRCLHPPGAATALAPIMAGHSLTGLGYGFVLMPVGLNVLALLIMAIAINRWLLGHHYPSFPTPAAGKQAKRNVLVSPLQRTDVSEQELGQVLDDMDKFMDVTPADLSQLLTAVQMQRFKRYRGNITCADIMVKDVVAVEFGTEVEDAWQIMCRENLKALPVVDTARRVIGIIVWSDFFKFINLNVYDGFQDKLRAFLRRTNDIAANKPEAVGQLMSATVVVRQESAHIAELIPLMSNQGYRQIPIVNGENRLVGMVYQANLIAALYNDSICHDDGTPVDGKH